MPVQWRKADSSRVFKEANSRSLPRHTPSPSASTKTHGRRRLETLVAMLSLLAGPSWARPFDEVNSGKPKDSESIPKVRLKNYVERGEEQ
jgi:hypothetical protein